MDAVRAGFWSMNHIVNPVVRWLLRSPFHRLLSRKILLITVRGRRTGRAYTIPVQYVRTGAMLYVVPGAAEHKTWWRNLRGGAEVRLLVQGHRCVGTADVLTGRDDPDTFTNGLARYRQRFPRAARARQVRAGTGGIPAPSDVRDAAARLPLVRISIAAPPLDAARPAEPG